MSAYTPKVCAANFFDTSYVIEMKPECYLIYVIF